MLGKQSGISKVHINYGCATTSFYNTNYFYEQKPRKITVGADWKKKQNKAVEKSDFP